ncbi:hypothetical protein Dsin_024228 [Dipteronia sinensis]|uniref:Uncharacterized protein n=1 Tax=Dipteronia sinensis TaxID=43782 RepID=A0AAE0DW04_9ROSI|nr:hypothetical protein Dsin_024228 [Dipteronia sinensis]
MHREMKFSGGIVLQLLLRELYHDGPTDEMRFILGNQNVHFFRVEFCLITGPKFGVILDIDVYDAWRMTYTKGTLVVEMRQRGEKDHELQKEMNIDQELEKEMNSDHELEKKMNLGLGEEYELGIYGEFKVRERSRFQTTKSEI